MKTIVIDGFPQPRHYATSLERHLCFRMVGVVVVVVDLYLLQGIGLVDSC